jgi:hypothetical protein
MSLTVEEVEKAVEQLSQDKLQRFRAWYERFDSKVWDNQIKNDVEAGKLDAFAQEAIKEHISGKSKKL